MGILSGKVAIVTGAAQGIGLGIARAFAQEDARLVLADTQAQAGASAAESICHAGGIALFKETDVTREDEVRQLVAAVVEHHSTVDIVVNNAGICVVKTVEDCTVEEWDRVMAVNVRAIFLTTKHCVPLMRRQGGGAILNVASISSFVGQQGTPAYSASKGAVVTLTKSLAVDYAPDKIRVNCICPGITDTPLLRFHLGHMPDPEAHLQDRLARVPLGGMLHPEDMGQSAVFLCSDQARCITGTSLVVDGGYIACAEFSPS